MSKYKWEQDSSIYFLATENGVDRERAIHGGFSQWVLGPGADFNPSEEFRGNPKIRSEDYNFFIDIFDPANPSTDVIPRGDAAAKSATDKEDAFTRFLSNDGSFQVRDPGNNIVLAAGTQKRDSFPDNSIFLATGIPASDSFTAEEGFTARLPIARSSVLKRGDVVQSVSVYKPPAGELPKPKVIVAIIDDSINPFRATFTTTRQVEKNPIASRFDYFWHQDGDSQSSSEVAFGREFKRAEIELILNDNINDEPAMLKRARLQSTRSAAPNPLNLSISHGTFIADSAAGYDPGNTTANEIRMIGVQLPVLASQDSSGISLIGGAVSAISFIFERATVMSRAIGTAMPVVLNFSYGLSSGPRDGMGILQRTISVQSKKYRETMVSEQLANSKDDIPVQIIVPAGNSHLSAGHVRSDTAQSDNEDMTLSASIQVQPEDRTSNFIEFWFPKSVTQAQLTVKLPNGMEETFEVNNDDFAMMLVDKDKQAASLRATIDGNEEPVPYIASVARLKLDELPSLQTGGGEKFGPPGNQKRLTLCIAPTKDLDFGRATAPCGEWSLSLSAKMSKDEQFTGWILRDESVSGFGQRGRQAYFLDDAYTDNRFDSMGYLGVFDAVDTIVKRDGTISSLTFIDSDDKSTFNVHIAGGFDETSLAAAAYSASSEPGASNVDVLLPTETSRALIGQLGAGTLTGANRILNGTSVAAPKLARLIIEKIRSIASTDLGSVSFMAFIQDSATPAPRPSINDPERRNTSSIRLERTNYGIIGQPIAGNQLAERKKYY